MPKVYWEVLSDIILLDDTKWFHRWKWYIHTLIIGGLHRLPSRFTLTKILLYGWTIIPCVSLRRGYRAHWLSQLRVYGFYLFTQCDDMPQLLHHVLLELFFFGATIKLRGTVRLVGALGVIISPHRGSLILVEHGTTYSPNLFPIWNYILGGSLW